MRKRGQGLGDRLLLMPPGSTQSSPSPTLSSSGPGLPASVHLATKVTQTTRVGTLGIDAWLFCSVLFCSVLFCSVLFCSVLFCSVLFCSVLFCSVSVLFCSVLFCSVLFCSVLFCSVLFCSVVCVCVLLVLFVFLPMILPAFASVCCCFLSV